MIDTRILESNVEVIIPTLNEEKTIGSIIERAYKYADKVLVIDGWSDDGTIEVAKKMGARIMFQNGRGKGAALKEAIEYVNGEIIVILDGDGSMKPEEIPIFLKGIYSGADIVKGSRFIDGGSSEDITFLRRLGNTLFTILVNIIWRSNFTDLCYGFMAFRKDAVKKLSPILFSKGFAIETEIIIKAKKLGLKIIEVPSFELKRLFGQSKLKTFRDGWGILTMILREALI
ncbi:MAG: glycosyltransferase family 2 protein [Candidatus Hodarchaeota archaeon]